jgi:hypothetical protein
MLQWLVSGVCVFWWTDELGSSSVSSGGLFINVLEFGYAEVAKTGVRFLRV